MIKYMQTQLYTCMHLRISFATYILILSEVDSDGKVPALPPASLMTSLLHVLSTLHIQPFAKVFGALTREDRGICGVERKLKVH